MTSLENEIRELFGPLDPGGSARVPAREQDADLERILSSRRPRRVSRRWLVAGAAAVGVAGAGVGVGVFRRESPPAYAVTPELLSFRRDPGSQAAPAVLDELAARVTTLPNDVGSGRYRHVTVLGWYLDSRTQGSHTTSATVRKTYETWLADDGSGRSIRGEEAPVFESEADRLWWNLFGGGADEEVLNWRPGEAAMTWTTPAPVDTAAMAQWLRISHPPGNGPYETLVAIADAYHEQVLTPPQRAAVLRVLATVPGLRYAGRGRDRVGRSGIAFTLDTTYGLPRRYTLIVDPANGGLLGFEQMLTTSPGALRVRIPAVISYDTFVQNHYVDEIGR